VRARIERAPVGLGLDQSQHRKAGAVVYDEETADEISRHRERIALVERSREPGT
jgi:hypothetical protein